MSDSTIKHGVQLDLQRGPLSLVFTEQDRAYAGDDADRETGSEATPGVDQTPLDRDAAKVRIFDVSAIQLAAVTQDPLVVLGKVRVQGLPLVLKSIQCTYTKSTGAGAASHPVSGMGGAIAGSGGVSFSPRASAQGSASITPTLTWEMDDPSTLLVDCENFFFFATSPMTVANALTKINTVSASTVANLPLFHDREIQFVVKGGQASVRASAETNIHASKSDSAVTSSGDVESGTESSKEVGLQTQREVIPRSLHAAITSLTASDTQTVTVDVEVSTPAVVVAAISIAAIDNHPSAVVGTAAASIVIPAIGTANIPATTPTDIPRTGRYLVDITGEEDIVGLVKVHAVVVNFAQYVWP